MLDIVKVFRENSCVCRKIIMKEIDQKSNKKDRIINDVYYFCCFHKAKINCMKLIVKTILFLFFVFKFLATGTSLIFFNCLILDFQSLSDQNTIQINRVIVFRKNHWLQLTLCLKSYLG